MTRAEQRGNTASGGDRFIVTVVGEDRVGIIAAVSTLVAEAGGNILDIRQGIMQEFFVMTMMVDLATASVSFDELRSRLLAKGDELRPRIDAQHEDVLKYMHRI